MTETVVTPPAPSRADQLIARLFRDGKVGADVRATAKEMFPDIVTPEDAAEPVIAPIRAALEATQAEFKAYREAQEAKEAAAADIVTQRTLEQRLDEARNKFNLRPEGYDKMVERMKETSNYSDPEAAAAWVAQTMAPPPPKVGPTWQPQALNLYQAESAEDPMALLWKDPDAYQDREFQAFVADPEGFTRETFGL